MRKIVIYTQRIEIIESYGERRDCADQRISQFLETCGYIPVPVSNVISDLAAFVDAVNPVGILFTGGNSLEKYGGDAPERDITDHQLVEIALYKNIPLYGFCRGMQSVLDYFGCSLGNVTGHVAVRHMIDGIWGKREVNSYHNQACRELKKPLQVMAQSEDGVIEAAAYPEKKIIVTMWHPERETPFQEMDIMRVRNLYEGAETEK
ncbi:MAG: gamma-glutamyl-gamma-aminobutyrate hydrolase family protein [Lachnospiraceae bacterium]|nr:gamma-glutamyl-gamma-aminobutyrate hydrolase family protein [Lachnospiraceae bacterium]MDE7204285.1 gamma-glutamyl-gamma-aminobutyrate hydrolase family protein [Lachnospiraceae bacterium]